MEAVLIQQPTAGDLRAIRERMGLSQRELAQALGFGENGARTIRAWEAGDIQPTPLAWNCLRYLAAVHHVGYSLPALWSEEEVEANSFARWARGNLRNALPEFMR